MNCDVLMVNAIGPAFTGETVRVAGIGGSELEITQIAEALSARGYKVIVANGVAVTSEDHGVRYVPLASLAGMAMQARALYIERGTTMPAGSLVEAERIVVRATDIMCEHYEPHREKIESGDAALVCVSRWQLDGFRRSMRVPDGIVIPPMLGEMPAHERKVPGRFIFASAPAKGLDATIAKWRQMRREHSEMRRCHLILAIPGFAMGEAPQSFGNADGIEYVGVPTIAEYRRLLASAEGLFYVCEMEETFCCVGALAERAGTRVAIWCRNGHGGMADAMEHAGSHMSREDAFDARVLEIARGLLPHGVVVSRNDLSPSALAPAWESALALAGVLDPPSDEQRMAQEPQLNTDEVPGFGPFLNLMRRSVAVGGSELGLGLSLFSLAVSIRAACIVEIGRFRGFSTLALAGALKWNTHGWQEPKAAEQRPDVDYAKLHGPKRRMLTSIDQSPDPAANALITEAGLDKHVHFVNQSSESVTLKGESIDLLFIDGDHSYEGIKRDISRFVPQVRAGGYVVLHDYFGWYDSAGKNGSAVARVVAELDAQDIERLLIDTGYASLVVFRKRAIDGVRVPAKVAPRSDGKPTVGLALLAKNENPIVARALGSCRAWVDCVTVLVDASSDDGTAELCERLGAEVHVRPYAGSLAETRNELLAIAEQRTDYLLLVDADDLIEGTRPPELTKDVYDLMVHDGNIQYPRGQLIKSRQGFRFVGCDRGCKGNIPHEYLDRPGATFGGVCPTMVYRRLGGIRGASGWQDQAGAKAKYLRHARDLARHHAEHPDHARTVFYLGQSFLDAGELSQARQWYARRAAMTAGDEEAWLAALRVAELTDRLGENPCEAYRVAYNMRPTRAEPLVALAIWYRDEKRKDFALAYVYALAASKLPMPDEKMFLAPLIYQAGAKAELALAAHYLGRHEEAIAIMEKLVPLVPPEQQAWARATLAQFLAARGR